MSKRPDSSTFVTREELAEILPWVTRAELQPALDTAAVVIAEGFLGFCDDGYVVKQLSGLFSASAKDSASPAVAYLLERVAVAIKNGGELPGSPRDI